MLCCVNCQSTIVIYDWIYYVLLMWIVFRWKNRLLKIICIRGVLSICDSCVANSICDNKTVDDICNIFNWIPNYIFTCVILQNNFFKYTNLPR